MDSTENAPIRFDRVLLTTDFSSMSEKALPYAAAIVRHFGATLYVVHVIATEDYAHIPPSEHTQALARMKQEAERQITAILATSHFQGIPHKIILDHGDVLTVLSRIVEGQDVDLIVAGTHGKHGLEKLLSGSMAEEIFRLASVPVLAIGPEVEIDPQAEVRLERILYATDFSPESGRALRYACALAKQYGAQLYFLHVVEDVWQEPLSTRVSAEPFCRVRLGENGFSDILEGLQPEFLVEFGMAEQLTLEVAQNRDVQLMVLSVPGTTHPALSAHFPGPIAYNIVGHARCPVLGVREKVESAKDDGVKNRSASD
jgi:nucleotide-binding universal stress UspA family protein